MRNCEQMWGECEGSLQKVGPRWKRNDSQRAQEGLVSIPPARAGLCAREGQVAISRPSTSPSVPLLQEAELERLEREFAIQSQITEAARRLASDPNVSKKLKKQRKTSYLNALKKLQEIENAINENRIKSGKKPTQRASLVIDGQCHPMPCPLPR